MKTLVVCSGGLDSVSLAYRIASEYQLAALLSFDYGQRHKKELDSAKPAPKGWASAIRSSISPTSAQALPVQHSPTMSTCRTDITPKKR